MGVVPSGHCAWLVSETELAPYIRLYYGLTYRIRTRYVI
jgi:hypothetical protein